MKKLTRTNLIALSGFLGSAFFVLSHGFGTANVSAETYQGSVDIKFTFNPALTVTISDDLNIGDLAPGTFADSNTVQVTVSTNNAYGYTLGATVGDTANNLSSELRHSSYTTTGDPIFSSIATDADLARTTFSSDSTYDNKWGFSVSNDGTTWGNYNGLPIAGGESALELLSSDYAPASGTASRYVKIGARAGANQSSGAYTNKINFIAVANPEPTLGPEACEAGKICYHPNSLGAVDGTMGRSSAIDGNTTTLLASNYSRNGYGFAGWNTAYDYSGTFYGPNEDITVPTGTTANGLSLYAIWIPSAGYMQTNASSVCNNLTTAPTNGTANLSSVSALTDERDNQTYAIAKLADGKCWMIENLRLESTASHNSGGTLAQGYNASFIGLATAESEHFSSSDTTANSLYTTESDIEGKITISGNYQAYRFPRYNNTNTSARASSPTANSGSMYSYGNYYTWHAAIADTTHYSSGDHGTTSICPTGWRLPIGAQSTADRSFGALSVALGGPEGGATANSSSTPTGAVMSTKFRSYPNNFLYSGYFNTSSAGSRGSYGYYWSSTAYNYNSSGSYYLYLTSSLVGPGTDYSYKYYGGSIRCLAL